MNNETQIPITPIHGMLVEIAPAYESDSPTARDIRKKRVLGHLASDINYFDGYQSNGGLKNFTYGFDSPEEQAELIAQAIEADTASHEPLVEDNGRLFSWKNC